MKKSLSYKAATQSPSPWNSPEKTSEAAISENLEQEVVVYRRPKAVGGGVNSIKSRTKPKLSGGMYIKSYTMYSIKEVFDSKGSL